MSPTFDEYMAEKNKEVTFDSYLAQKQIDTLRESIPTPEPSSLLQRPITTQHEAPTILKNALREVLSSPKMLAPAFEPNYFLKHGPAEMPQMVEGMARRYGPLLTKSLNAGLGGNMMLGSIEVGKHVGKMAEEAPIQTALEALMGFRGTQYALTDKFVLPPELKTAIERIQTKAPELNIKEPTAPIDPTDISVKRVTEALKGAKPLRGEQESLYKQERAARLGKLRKVQKETTGEAGFFAEKGQLKGELPKIEYESIREQVTQTDIDNLFNRVKDAPMLTDWEKITAREGLSKIFAEHGGRVPTKGELSLLDQVFPSEFLETLLSKQTKWAKIKAGLLEVANIPRSVMASFDLSFGGRQGAFAAPKFRKAFFDSWKKQFKIFGSEKAYQAARESLFNDPDFMFAKEMGVDFTDIGKMIRRREEKFMSSWAEEIPLVGKGIRASGRAYTSFANRFRLDIFKDILSSLEKQGLDPRSNSYLARKTADFVNNATGRGSLGVFESAAPLLNAMFFSPRLNMARIRTLNPTYYVFLPKGLRKQALYTALQAGGTATTILTAAKLAGADVTADPRNSDFGKIRIENTRLDMLAGYGQFIRGFAQLATNEYTSSRTGRTYEMGERYGSPTRMDMVIRQIESKESPIASFATGWLRGKNWTGEPFSIPKEIGNRFIPMVVSDMSEIYRDDPSLLGLSTLGFFGIGVQTYSPKKVKR